MKLRLPLLLRLALLSTAAAYTLGSGCLFADDAPADAAQDDPIAEAVDEEESDSPAIGFEGYTESQLVDIQSSDSAGSVIRQMLENSTTGAVANVGTSSSSSNGATAAAESPALTLSAPAGPAADTTLTTSTLSDSAGEGAVAPFFSAEEAAALVVASPATSTPSVKNASTATLSSSDSPDETTSSSSATGAVSASLGSVGSASAGGASSGGGATYSLTSSAPDSSSSSLVTTTPTDDTSSDPIAEDVLEDSTTEDTTTSTLPDSSASTLAGTSSTSATTRTLPALKLLGSTSETSTQGTVVVDSVTMTSGDDKVQGVQFLYGKMGGSGDDVNIIYLHNDPSTYPSVVEVDANSFYICPNNKSPKFSIGALKTDTPAATVKIQNNEWSGNENSTLTLTLDTLSVNGSASLEVNQTRTGAITVSIGKVANSSTESTTGPLLTSVKNSGTLNLGTNASGEGESKVTASSISIGSLTNSGTMTLNGETTITEKLTNTGTLTVNSGATLVGKIDSTGTLKLNGIWDLTGVEHDENRLTNVLSRTSENSSGLVKLKCSGEDKESVYKIDTNPNTHGVSLQFVAEKVTRLNGWSTDNNLRTFTVTKGSSISTGGDLRLETQAKLQVQDGGAVKVGGKLSLGHTDGSNYGHFSLDGGQLIAQGVGRTNPSDAVASNSNTFTMTGGVLTLTQGGDKAFSDVYTVISRGTLDTSQAAWGITSSADGSVSVGGVTVSDAYTTEEGTTNNSGYALTLTGAKITGDISLEGTAGLVLKNVTVTGNDVKLGGDGRTVQVASGNLTVENSVTTKGNLEVATGNNLVVKGTYATSGANSSLKLQGEATASLQNGETVVATVKKNGTEADASITSGVTMKYDSDSGKAVIAGAGNGSVATISNAAIDVAAGSKLELSNVVLAETTWLHDEETTGDGGSTSPYTGSVDLNGVEGKVTGTGEDGGTLQAGTVLTKTGTTGSGEGATLPLQSEAKVFKIAYSQINQMASIGGSGLTLDFDTYDGGKGFASLYETLNGKYDYVAIEFDSTVGEINFSTLEVNAKITNGDRVTGTTTGYYVGDTAVVNATSSSGVVVYFDAIALPEPTTSTLGLLALAALCARRRRSRTRAHAEHA